MTRKVTATALEEGQMTDDRDVQIATLTAERDKARAAQALAEKHAAGLRANLDEICKHSRAIERAVNRGAIMPKESGE